MNDKKKIIEIKWTFKRTNEWKKNCMETVRYRITKKKVDNTMTL